MNTWTSKIVLDVYLEVLVFAYVPSTSMTAARFLTYTAADHIAPCGPNVLTSLFQSCHVAHFNIQSMVEPHGSVARKNKQKGQYLWFYWEWLKIKLS